MLHGVGGVGLVPLIAECAMNGARGIGLGTKY